MSIGRRGPMVEIGPIHWSARRSGDCWIAVCDAIGLTVESGTWAELMEDIAAALDAVFKDLWASGDLERFLRDHELLPPEPVAETMRLATEPVFDIPFLPALVANEDSAATAYR